MKFTVTRQRAYWVKETQVVEADSEEQAEDVFYDEFDPVLEVMDWFQFGSGEFTTPLQVHKAEGRSDG